MNDFFEIFSDTNFSSSSGSSGRPSEKANKLFQPITNQIDQLSSQLGSDKLVFEQLEALKKEYIERTQQAMKQGNGANQLMAAYSEKLQEKLNEWQKNPPQLKEALKNEVEYLSPDKSSDKKSPNLRDLISQCKEKSHMWEFLKMGGEGAARGLQDLARRIYDAGVPRIAALVLIEKVCKIGWAIGKGIIEGCGILRDNWNYTKTNNVDSLIGQLNKEIDKAAPKDDVSLSASASQPSRPKP